MLYSSEKSIQLFGHEVQYHRAENKQVVTITLDNKNQMVAGWQTPFYADKYTITVLCNSQDCTASIRRKIGNDFRTEFIRLGNPTQYLNNTLLLLQRLFSYKPEGNGTFPYAVLSAVGFGTRLALAFLTSKQADEKCFVQFRKKKGSQVLRYLKDSDLIDGTPSKDALSPVTVKRAMSPEIEFLNVSTAQIIVDTFLITTQRFSLSGQSPNRVLTIKADKPELISIATGKETGQPYKWQWVEGQIGTKAFNKQLSRFDNRTVAGPSARLKKLYEEAQKNKQ